MNRNTWNDEEINDGEDDFAIVKSQPRVEAKRTGAITAVAVITFVTGVLALLLAILTGLFASTLGVRSVFFRGAHVVEKIITLEIGLFLVWGVLAIASGAGLLKRQQWGRVLALMLAAVAAFAGLGEFLFGLVIKSGFHVPQAAPFVLVVSFVKMFLGFIFVCYFLWIFAVLLKSKNASGFH